MLWLTFIHTFMGNRPKLADWSKLVCITPRSCLCSFLTSNWEVNADLSLNRFLIISQIVQLPDSKLTLILRLVLVRLVDLTLGFRANVNIKLFFDIF